MAGLVATVRYEGGYYTPDLDPSAPIRIYADGRIADDIIGRVRREILSAEEVARIREAAAENRRKGWV